MKSIRQILTVALLGLLLAGCPTSHVNTEKMTETELFMEAEKSMQDGAYKSAIKLFEELNNRYPYGSYSEQIQLDLIYAYYKSGDLLLAQTAIDRFIKLNPTHPNIDYVFYVRGLIDTAFDDNMIQGWFGVDRSDRDPTYARLAFQDFSQLIANYPNSIYSADAEKRLIFLKNRLARYDLHVVKYYKARQAYIAVINRAKEMLVNYPDTEATREALVHMEDSYNQLGLIEEAQKTRQLIEANM